ncbi:MAG: glutamate--tRNA ligase family protein, partial [Pseudomonadota bacterium]
DEGPLYPGTCRPAPGVLASEPAALGTPDVAWRVRTDRLRDDISFSDSVQGPQQISARREIGDFVLRRRDGLFAYQLAVAVDDAQQGVTHVVRGIDLLRSTFRQILLMRHLGARVPQYAHFPVVVDARGAKLSKRDAAPSIENAPPSSVLVDALSTLMQAPPSELRRSNKKMVLSWAVEHWKLSRLAGIESIPCDPTYF